MRDVLNKPQPRTVLNKYQFEHRLFNNMKHENMFLTLLVFEHFYFLGEFGG